MPHGRLKVVGLPAAGVAVTLLYILDARYLVSIPDDRGYSQGNGRGYDGGRAGAGGGYARGSMGLSRGGGGMPWALR